MEIGRCVSALFVDYQQLAVRKEKAAAEAVTKYYGISLTKLRWVGQGSKTDGLIPGRNAFLLSVALMEMPATVNTVAIGIHDGTSYKDCSKEFIERVQKVFDIYTDKHVNISAPFAEWSKPDILAYCSSRTVPVDLTYSCEFGKKEPCGSCLSCLDRKTLDVSA